jgi:hypothetical protein
VRDNLLVRIDDAHVWLHKNISHTQLFAKLVRTVLHEIINDYWRWFMDKKPSASKHDSIVPFIKEDKAALRNYYKQFVEQELLTKDVIKLEYDTSFI